MSTGIGLGLVEVYLGRPNTTVIAAVRNPSDIASLASLQKLKAGANSKLIIVKIDSTSPSDADEAVRLLETEHGITAVDTVIANAGICTTSGLGPVAQTALAELRSHFEVNAIGTLSLFQAIAPFLEASRDGKFVALSDSTADLMADPFSAYGVSKAALNFIVRKIHHEHPKITSMSIYPG